jgi:ribosomal protein L12E/L44/L45/RPP1/RPP2
MIDPAVDVDGEVLALSEETQANPLDATGKSVFDLLVDAGLGDLVVAQDSAGGAAAGGAGADAGQDEAAQDDAAQDDAAQDEANQEEDAAAGEQDAAGKLDIDEF